MNRIKIWLVIFSFTSIHFAYAQKSIKKLAIVVSPPVCYASNKVEKSFIPPPAFINLKSNSEKKCEIIVDYNLFPKKAKDAFEYAVNIWEFLIESEVPIYIQANWLPQGTNVLGSAGPSGYYTNFKNIPHENRFYPVAIAEKITKAEITGPSSPDIVATFNKDIKWYFGTEGAPDSLYDFITVVLHEITHGLGFTGFFYTSDNLGLYGNQEIGDAAAFDLLVSNNYNQAFVDTSFFEIQSTKLNDALVSGSVYANSPVAIANNNGNKPKLYSPATWDDGSSIYHLNEFTYPSNTPNSLMTYAIGKGEAIHDPGPITKGLMDDIGWKHMYLNLEKPKDIETAQAITFDVSIESDYGLDTTSLFVFYSSGSFTEQIDSMPLLPTETTNHFTAELTPQIATGIIHYYISAKDTMHRIFTIPTEAPADLYSVTIGPDNQKPEVSHIPITYFLLAGKNLPISVNADDNLGIDTVFVEYTINGQAQTPFGLALDSSTSYSGVFNFNLGQLNDGDEIMYNITAKDSSLNQNKTKIPFKDVFSFKVEKIFDPIVNGYINDFNSPTTDFILTDFDIYTEAAFENGALQSPHPYPSTEENTSNFNFSTIFKRPIIISESGTMSFDEIVLVEPGEFQTQFGDDEFWDYVIVEGSKDFGETWQQLINGYDSDANSIWKTNYNADIVDQNSQTVGIPEWYVNREINIPANGNFALGDTILIRFRLFSDPFAHGWGWAIDNLQIQFPVSSPITTLSPGNIMVYPNPFNGVVNISVHANKNIDEIEFEIYNTFGQKIQNKLNKNVIGEISYKFNLGNYADGMYFISVKENGKQVYSKKIIKKG